MDVIVLPLLVTFFLLIFPEWKKNFQLKKKKKGLAHNVVKFVLYFK